MKELIQERKAIEVGSRVAEFLKDPAIKQWLIDLEREYYAEFKKATTDEKRAEAWAKSRVLDDVFNGTTVLVERGKRAADAVQKAEEQEEAIQARQARLGRPR